MTEISRLSLDDDNETMNSAPPELNTPGVVAIDITDKFSRASKGD